MAIEVVNEYVAGETVRIRVYIYDDDGDLVDPTSVKCTIIDDDGTTQVDAQDMTQDVAGVYDYYYNTTTSSATGWWRGQVDVVDGTGGDARTSIAAFGFRVK